MSELRWIPTINRLRSQVMALQEKEKLQETLPPEPPEPLRGTPYERWLAPPLERLGEYLAPFGAYGQTAFGALTAPFRGGMYAPGTESEWIRPQGAAMRQYQAWQAPEIPLPFGKSLSTKTIGEALVPFPGEVGAMALPAAKLAIRAAAPTARRIAIEEVGALGKEIPKVINVGDTVKDTRGTLWKVTDTSDTAMLGVEHSETGYKGKMGRGAVSEVIPEKPVVPVEAVKPEVPVQPVQGKPEVALIKRLPTSIGTKRPMRPMSETQKFLENEAEKTRFLKELPIGKTFKYVDESSFKIREGKILGVAEDKEGEAVVRIKPPEGKEFTVSPEYLVETYSSSIEEQIARLIERTKSSIRLAKGEGIYREYADTTLQAKYEAELRKLQALSTAKAPQQAVKPEVPIQPVQGKPIQPVQGKPPVVPPKEPPVKPPTEPPVGAGETPKPKPEFAGNIRLSKFDKSVHDELLDWSSDAERVERQRRGVRSWATTREAAENMAEIFGENPEKIGKRLGQAYNAEEMELITSMSLKSAQDYRVVKDAIIAGSDTTLNKLNAANLKAKMEYWFALRTRAGAEAGRALNVMKKTAEAMKTKDQKIMEGVLRKVGGSERLDEFLKLSEGIDWDNPAQVANLVRQMVKVKWWQYPHEIYINSILSGIKTHIVNALSTGLYVAKAPVDSIVAGLIDAPLAAIARRPRSFFAREALYELAGAKQGITDGVRASLATWKYGMSPMSIAKLEFRPAAFKGKVGRVINAPVTAMEAVDQLYYNTAYRMGLNKFAYRTIRQTGAKGQKLANDWAELVSQPTEDLISQAEKYATERLFRREAGKTIQALMRFRESFAPLKFVIPFIRTPVNLAKVGLETSPLGIFNPKLIMNLAKGRPEAAEQLAKVAIGGVIAGALYLYAKDGMITGSAPTNPTQRDTFYASGKTPFSIKIGNRWVSYQRVEPFNLLFTQVAAVVEAMENQDATWEQKAGEAAMTIAKNLHSQTYVSSLSDIFDAVADPERLGTRLLQRFVASMVVPESAMTRTIAQSLDPMIRKPTNVWESIQASIPVLSQNVPAMVSQRGIPQERRSPAWSPISVTEETGMGEMAERRMPSSTREGFDWGLIEKKPSQKKGRAKENFDWGLK